MWTHGVGRYQNGIASLTVTDLILRPFLSEVATAFTSQPQCPRLLFPHLLSSACCYLALLIVASLVGMKWHLVVLEYFPDG